MTDDFLRSYLAAARARADAANRARPSCALHDALHAPIRARVVDADELAAIADAGRARELRHLAALSRAPRSRPPSLEAAYIGLFHGDGVDVPPLFVAQLTQVILRHISATSADPLEARAAEMLFRTQKIAVTDDGAVMAADEVTVELFARHRWLRFARRVAGDKPHAAAERSTSTCSTSKTARRTGTRDERHDLVGEPQSRPRGARRR